MTMRLPAYDTGEGTKTTYATMGYYRFESGHSTTLYPWIHTYKNYLLARRARLYWKAFLAGTINEAGIIEKERELEREKNT